jgi:CRP/FNR family transcriptional regulator, cyclic AMP receptor protein
MEVTMAVAETTLGGTGERVRVFEEAPELLQQVRNGDAAALRQVTTQMIRLDRGIWELKLGDAELEGHLGLLVLDGLLTRQVAIGEATCAELLGGGDVLRPWTEIDSQIASVTSESRWQVVMPTRVAVLSSRFALQICRWPSVTAAIIDRVVQRARWLSFHLAVCHIVGVEARLLLVLWHFADRWGRVTASGVKLPLPLSHGLLAGIVGARRPTVSTALGVLRDQGRVERTDGGWLLHGDPPVELHELRANVAARKPTFGNSVAPDNS